MGYAEKKYGEDLPENLLCKKILLNAGRSGQASLLGRRPTTFETLYISKAFPPAFDIPHQQLSLLEAIA
ncbi:MAG: hypothetical protein NC112_03560 [Oxalobacter formigenes]|nr:hypothetical protein [Oxalobacter formigenes]